MDEGLKLLRHTSVKNEKGKRKSYDFPFSFNHPQPPLSKLSATSGLDFTDTNVPFLKEMVKYVWMT